MPNIEWNVRACLLKSHVSTHKQSHDDLIECSAHIECVVAGPAQKVECIIDDINCTDSTLQDAIGLFIANSNIMREDFEAGSSPLIEVDPYYRSSRSTGHNANVSIA